MGIKIIWIWIDNWSIEWHSAHQLFATWRVISNLISVTNLETISSEATVDDTVEAEDEFQSLIVAGKKLDL